MEVHARVWLLPSTRHRSFVRGQVVDGVGRSDKAGRQRSSTGMAVFSSMHKIAAFFRAQECLWLLGRELRIGTGHMSGPSSFGPGAHRLHRTPCQPACRPVRRRAWRRLLGGRLNRPAAVTLFGHPRRWRGRTWPGAQGKNMRPSHGWFLLQPSAHEPK